MNEHFAAATSAIPELFERLVASTPVPVAGRAADKNRPGVYIFLEHGEPVHVGRTRNLGGRLASHTTPKHNKASFAFKRARRHLDQKASYKVANSRSALVLDEVFGPEFLRQVGLIKAMQLKFVEVKDPIAQYLLELYAHMEFGLPLDEFDTH